MSVIIKGNSAFEMSLVSSIKDVESRYIKFQNIYFKCKSIEDAGGTIFVKRKKGKWIPHREKSREYIGTTLIHVTYDYWLCDTCGYRVENGRPMYNFCPNCGADMRGEQDGRSI